MQNTPSAINPLFNELFEVIHHIYQESCSLDYALKTYLSNLNQVNFAKQGKKYHQQYSKINKPNKENKTNKFDKTDKPKVAKQEAFNQSKAFSQSLWQLLPYLTKYLNQIVCVANLPWSSLNGADLQQLPKLIDNLIEQEPELLNITGKQLPILLNSEQENYCLWLTIALCNEKQNYLELYKQEKDLNKHYEALPDSFKQYLNHIEQTHTNTLSHLFNLDCLKYALPNWLWQALQQQYQNTAAPIAQSLLSDGDLHIRINKQRISMLDFEALLKEANINYEVLPSGKMAIKLLNKPNLKANKQAQLWQSKAYYEVQNLGSQLITQLVQAKRQHLVFDVCAGSGGKTFALLDDMAYKGHIYALDNNAMRLNNLQQRLKCYQEFLDKQVIYTQLVSSLNDTKVQNFHGKADKVLVDAPCSGMGRLRRNAENKWFYSQESIEAFTSLQLSLLKQACKLLKVGGQMVYATCSVLPQENQELIEQFLAEHANFSLVPVSQLLPEKQQNSLQMQNYLVLNPHQHQTDGFFAAVVQKNA